MWWVWLVVGLALGVVLTLLWYPLRDTITAGNEKPPEGGSG